MDIVVTGQRVRREMLESTTAITVIDTAKLEDLGDLKLYRVPFPVTVAANGQKQVALLVKDNHAAAAGGVEAATRAARAHAPPHLHLQVEVESLEDARAAAAAGADSLLLDNLPPEAMRRIVEALGERLPLEASGGVSLENVRRVAETGVQRISIGALTHSAPVADVALEMRPGGVAA